MEHRRQWHCPSCEGVFETRISTEDHLATEHSSIKTSLYGDLIEAASQHVQILEDPQCLFCDESGLWDQSTGTAPKLDLHASKNQSVSTNSFRRHVGRHLEQIALFAVPSTVQDTEADDVNSTASQDTYGEIDTTSRIDSIAVELDRDGDAGDRSSEDGTVGHQILGSHTDISTSSPSTLSQGVTDVAAGESSQRPNFESHSFSESSTSSIGSVSRSSSDALRDRLAALEARAGPPGDDSPTRRSNTPPLAASGTNSLPHSHSQTSQPSHPSEMLSVSPVDTPSEDEGQLDGHMQKSSSFERLDGRKVKEHTSSDRSMATHESKPENILIDQYGDNVLNNFDVHPSFQPNRLKTDRPTASDNVANDVATSESPDDTAQLISDERYPEDQFDRKVSPEQDSADQTTRRRRLSLTTPTGQRQTTDTSLDDRSPGLNLLPSLRSRRTDNAQDLTPQTVFPDISEVVRLQNASDEAILRRQEDLEAAENRNIEAWRAQYPGFTYRESDGRERPSPLLHSSQRTPKYVIEGRKFYDDTREEADAKALRLNHEQRIDATEGERGPGVIERERAIVAAEEDRIATEDQAESGVAVEVEEQGWAEDFDERFHGGEFDEYPERSARPKTRRRKERDDSPRRREGRGNIYRRYVGGS
jgi:hypothetical protein